jgi:hypothetical protein
MTVQELIDALSTFDPGLRVVMPGEDTDFCEVGSAFRDLVQFYGPAVELADERDSERFEIVRLFGPEQA